MAVTETNSVTDFEGAKVCQCSTENGGTLRTKGWDAKAERRTVRDGGTETEIPSEATEGLGLLARWAMVDRERVRIGLRW